MNTSFFISPLSSSIAKHNPVVISSTVSVCCYKFAVLYHCGRQRTIRKYKEKIDTWIKHCKGEILGVPLWWWQAGRMTTRVWKYNKVFINLFLMADLPRVPHITRTTIYSQRKIIENPHSPSSNIYGHLYDKDKRSISCCPNHLCYTLTRREELTWNWVYAKKRGPDYFHPQFKPKSFPDDTWEFSSACPCAVKSPRSYTCPGHVAGNCRQGNHLIAMGLLR